jgi:glucose-1-phosphate cytidylyltransferase
VFIRVRNALPVHVEFTAAASSIGERAVDRQSPVVILCGRDGSSDLGAMAEIGDLPVLWHVMKLCAHHGYRRFVLGLGDGGWWIKRFFLDFQERLSDVTITTGRRYVPQAVERAPADWEITFVDTGTRAGAGARLRRVRHHLDGEHLVVACLDGIGPVDLTALASEHLRTGRIGTVAARTAADPASYLEGGPPGGAGLVPAGFSIFRRSFVHDHLDDDAALDLAGPLQRLARDGELGVHRHHGFWSALETEEDRRRLDALWTAGEPPWRVWDAVPAPRAAEDREEPAEQRSRRGPFVTER